FCHVIFFFQAEDGIRDGHVTGVKTCALPISMKGDRERCLAAGMDEYVTKPLDSRQLCAVVEQMAVGGRPASMTEAATAPVSTAEIGRASCRERVEKSAGTVVEKSKERKQREE